MNLLVLLRPVLLVLAAACLSSMPSSGRAADVWLMTYGTGDRIEERFGHNALWVRDPAQGVDAIYNFGFFDFDTPGFYFDYLFGELIYYAVARDPGRELAYYEWRDRSVRAQRLDFDEATVRRLTEWLDQRVAPENRNFRYDYYLNNCSTRVRDALDFALDGALRRVTEAMPAEQDFRAHTRRLVRPDPVLYLAIQAALGRPVDRPINRWDEMFLPEVVAATVRDFAVPDGRDGTKPLVLDDRVLLVSGRPDPAETPTFPWGPLMAVLFGAAALVLVPVVAFRRRGWKLAGWRCWLVLNAVAGSLLAFLWLATEHAATAFNENLLLINPMLVLLWRARGGRIERAVSIAVLACLAIAVGLKLDPSSQWNLDLLTALVPVQLAALWVWRREVRIAVSKPSALSPH